MTVVWIVGVTNAMNLVDGMDGLAGAIGWIAAVAFGIIAATAGRMDIVIVTTALMGALAAFLRFNWRPASIHLGDGGSLFLGFFLAIVGLQTLQGSAGEPSVLIPLLILVVPLADTTFAVLRRVWMRRSPLERDRGHIHHRLVRRGWTPVQTVLWLSIITLLGSVAAVALQFGCAVSWVLGGSTTALLAVVSIVRGFRGRNAATTEPWSGSLTKAGRP